MKNNDGIPNMEHSPQNVTSVRSNGGGNYDGLLDPRSTLGLPFSGIGSSVGDESSEGLSRVESSHAMDALVYHLQDTTSMNTTSSEPQLTVKNFENYLEAKQSLSQLTSQVMVISITFNHKVSSKVLIDCRY